MPRPTSASDVEKYLGEPVFIGLDEKAEKLKRNLLLVGFIAVFSVISGLKIDPSSSIFGLKFNGLTSGVVSYGMLIVIIFTLVHYLWVIMDSFVEWRLRLTGTRVKHVTVGRSGSDVCDYPDNPRQSTLYNWWLESSKNSIQINSNIEKIKNEVNEVNNILSKLDSLGGDPYVISCIKNIDRSVHEVKKDLMIVGSRVEQFANIISSNRVPVSLARFDNWFWFFSRSQCLRWLIFDLVAPVSVGVSAIVLILVN